MRYLKSINYVNELNCVSNFFNHLHANKIYWLIINYYTMLISATHVFFRLMSVVESVPKSSRRSSTQTSSPETWTPTTSSKLSSSTAWSSLEEFPLKAQNFYLTRINIDNDAATFIWRANYQTIIFSQPNLTQLSVTCIAILSQLNLNLVKLGWENCSFLTGFFILFNVR